MIKKILLVLLLSSGLSAKNVTITPNDVYAQVVLITDQVHYLLNYYDIEENHSKTVEKGSITTKLKPRNVWQMTYEIMVKINIFREAHGLPTIEPVNLPPVLDLNPNLVYEQTQRILTELKIFMIRKGIETPVFELKKFKNKTPLDVYVGLSHVSLYFDKLNGGRFTPSYVFGEQMRLYDDITRLLQALKIEDKTIPKKKKIDAVSEDVFNESMKMLEKIKQLQIGSGISFVDFKEFRNNDVTPGEVYTITQMNIAEFQTLKAYVGIQDITPSATKYDTKTPSEVLQLVSWNLRKLNLLNSINQGR